MKVSERFFLIRELARGVIRGRLELLSEEYLWNELLSGRYFGKKRTLVMSYVLGESARNARDPGPRGQRCGRLLEMFIERFGSDLPLNQMTRAQRDHVERWPGLVNHPNLKNQLRVLSK